MVPTDIVSFWKWVVRQACRDVFEGLAHCEEVLSNSRFLCGERFTEADLRLLPTAVRFDAVYATLFKCSNRYSQSFASYPSCIIVKVLSDELMSGLQFFCNQSLRRYCDQPITCPMISPTNAPEGAIMCVCGSSSRRKTCT